MGIGIAILFKNRRPLILLVINCFLLDIASSEVYVVGDQEKWDTGVNYVHWSQKYNFTVGDVLDFKYVKGQHNVYEVTEGTYESCDSTSGVLNKYDSGDDRVELTKSKPYWFICNVIGHCHGGMRFNIFVSSNSTNVFTNRSASSPPLEASPPSSSSFSNRGLSFWLSVLVSGIVLRT